MKDSKRFKTFEDLCKYWEEAVEESPMADSFVFLTRRLQMTAKNLGMDWDWDTIPDKGEKKKNTEST